MSVKITGLRALIAKLEKMGPAGELAASNVMNRVGERTRERAIQGMAESPPTGATYRRTNPRRLHTASAPGAYPRIDRKKLIKSIKVTKTSPKSKIMRVGSNLPQGEWLEYGTPKMPARPWLFRSYRSAVRSVGKELRQEFEALR
jgi:HK97 gp10 family phage protein